MAITKLQLFNIAAFALGEEKLSTTSDGRPLDNALNEVWDRGLGFITAVLEQGQWNFAMRAVQIDASTSVTPSFGFTNAFDKPTDFVRVNMISADENFSEPLTQYEFEGAYIYAHIDPLYLRYVSNGASYGADLSLWPDSFSNWAGTWLGLQIARKTLSDADYKELMKTEKMLLSKAKSIDASNEPTRFVPLSSWARSRGGRSWSRRDRGSRGSLTG